MTTITTIIHQEAAGSRQMLGSLRSPRAPHIQPLSATIHHEQHIHHHNHIQPHTATYSHIQPHTATYSHYQRPSDSRQQAHARLAALASRAPYPAIISDHHTAASQPFAIAPARPPSRARSSLAVCANDCAWIIIHFGFSVLDNYSFLPLSVNNFNKVGGKIPASRLSLLAFCPSATLRRQ